MDSFMVAFVTVAVAEMGDRTQLLSLILAARYRRPWPIIGGIAVATLANHAIAGALGAWLGHLLDPPRLDFAVGVSMAAMALWTLRPDKMEEGGDGRRGSAFAAAVTTFFIAEIGDKTQIATLALSAAYPGLVAIVAGSTMGMLAANIPVVFLGKAFAERLPLAAIRYVAAVLFLALGAMFIHRAGAAWQWW